MTNILKHKPTIRYYEKVLVIGKSFWKIELFLRKQLILFLKHSKHHYQV